MASRYQHLLLNMDPGTHGSRSGLPGAAEFDRPGNVSNKFGSQRYGGFDSSNTSGCRQMAGNGAESVAIES